jgi:hypothetical protein
LTKTEEIKSVLQETEKKQEVRVDAKKEQEEKAKTEEIQIFNYSTRFKQISDPSKRRETARSAGDKAWRDGGGYKNRY